MFKTREINSLVSKGAPRWGSDFIRGIEEFAEEIAV